MNKRNGFTLLEILIVIIIVAVLASVAIPSYENAIERGRSTEAIDRLGYLRKMQVHYSSIYGAATSSYNCLGVNPENSVSPYYTFTIFGCSSCPCSGPVVAAPFTACALDAVAGARRNDTSNGNFGNYTLYINSSGQICCTPAGGQCPSS